MNEWRPSCIHPWLLWWKKRKMIKLSNFNRERRKDKNMKAPCKKCDTDFPCLFDRSLVENEIKFNENPIIFLGNPMKIPWLQPVQNPCHVPAWTTNNPGWMTWNSHGWWCGFWPNCCGFLTWNDMEFPWESMSHFLQGWIKFDFQNL